MINKNIINDIALLDNFDKLNNTYYTAYFKDNLLFNLLNNKTILKIKLVLKYANIIKIYLMKILLKLLIIL